MNNPTVATVTRRYNRLYTLIFLSAVMPLSILIVCILIISNPYNYTVLGLGVFALSSVGIGGHFLFKHLVLTRKLQQLNEHSSSLPS